MGILSGRSELLEFDCNCSAEQIAFESRNISRQHRRLIHTVKNPRNRREVCRPQYLGVLEKSKWVSSKVSYLTSQSETDQLNDSLRLKGEYVREVLNRI